MVLLLLATLAVIAPVAGALGAVASPQTARLDVYPRPDGSSAFALSLTPAPIAVADSGARDVIVLVETSASQTGDYRNGALSMVNALLRDLDPRDRVLLLAADLDTNRLSEGFVAPGSPEMAQAVQKLNARVPLGSTDMENVLTAVATGFAGRTGNARAAVYIGQARSPANVVPLPVFDGLVKQLVDARIAVTAFAIGPNPDLRMLGALANHTGGDFVADKGGDETAAAAELAGAVRGTVLWPVSVTWPAAMTEVFPKNTPPLRSDRDSVVIGTLKGSGPMEIKMTCEVGGAAKNLAWTVQPNPSNDDYSYLVQLVDVARADGGMGLPIPGSSGLRLVRQIGDAGARNLTILARQALKAGNAIDAQRLAEAALKLDPHDPEALIVRNAAGKPQTAGGGTAVPASAASADLNLTGAGGQFADSVERDRRLLTQAVQADVQTAVNQARTLMATDPEGAIQNLKIAQERLRQTRDLSAEARQQLDNTLQGALREGSRRLVEEEHRRQMRYEREAAAKERQLINEGLAKTQMKMKQLMERFDALMDEGRYHLAEESPAAEAQKIAPDSPMVKAAVLSSRIGGDWHEMMEIRTARYKGFDTAMALVERSHIPFPDDPPIVYPPAADWQRLTAERREKYRGSDLASRGPAEKKIDEALHSPTQMEFSDTPLNDVIDFLKEYHKINIELDKKALEDAGVALDAPVTRNLKNISLRSALRLMLHDLGMTYVIQDEVLLITTPEIADAKLTTKVYPVADLVLPIRTPAISGLGGMGGGMGGSMLGGGGGGGMGGMGGGMGGMGGGMGGMGGGMGGMLNVPLDMFPRIFPQNNPQVPGMGLNAFCVKDDLNLTGEPARPATVSAEKPAAEDLKAHQIHLEMAADEDPNVAWDRYFSAHREPAAAVRDAVRRLTSDKKFDHVMALINAALRHRQGQPWMYEALALAMQMTGRPVADVERALMSAADFAQSPSELLFLAIYMDRNGFDARAMKLYRQVAALEPSRAEPYVAGLKLAQRIDDEAGTKWACLGILSHAWPKQQLEIWKNADRVAKALLAKLKTEKRTAELKQFQQAVDAALVRDCVIIVSWTGEGDVDLFVQEPSGTICSFRAPRTTAGGVLLGDMTSAGSLVNADGHSQVYVCAEGFSGNYKLLARRVWGKVTSNKVNVEIYTHFRSGQQRVVQKRIPLDKDEAMVAFDLDQGRRKESLQQQQIANAVADAGQAAVTQQVLAQQLAAVFDPQAAAAQAAQLIGSNTGVIPGTVTVPFVPLTGAVGYEPVIITLPEGANFMATAVVSADRRYVRVTSVPFFSAVGPVYTFNMATGANTPGAGGGSTGYSGQ
jgi:hypothetical protein